MEIIENETLLTKSDVNKGRLAALASVIGALLASSCCIAPLVLVTLGVSGAWIGNLSVLEPYKPIFAGITFVFLGAGYWWVYHKPKVACEGSYCASPASNHLTKGALWLAVLLVVLAMTIDFWAPFFY
ncbi:MAG: mercury transporter MerT [Proteobacteria bacterium]|nr:mercury transporter MerT [Pseudomonadota bacterium]